MTVLVYVDTSKQVGDPDHIKVFATNDPAERWLLENDPEGEAFEYEVFGVSKPAHVLVLHAVFRSLQLRGNMPPSSGLKECK
jgi:hypothetical protein